MVSRLTTESNRMTEQAKEELQALGEDVQDAFIIGTQSKKRQIIKDYTAAESNDYQGIDILDEKDGKLLTVAKSLSGDTNNVYAVIVTLSEANEYRLDENNFVKLNSPTDIETINIFLKRVGW